MSEWQPIETAPKEVDCLEPILIWCDESERWDIVYTGWIETDGKPVWFNGDVSVKATHWMWPPEPPHNDKREK